MQWRHLNVFNKECVIVCLLPRGRRGYSDMVYRVTSAKEWHSEHFNKGGAFAVALMREMPVKRAGKILGESDSRICPVLLVHVRAVHARLGFDKVVVDRADELNRRNGYNYLTEFDYLVANRVLFTTPGKDASDRAAFAAELLQHNGYPKAI